MRPCCNHLGFLGDSIDPRSRAYQAEALHVQTVEKEAARVATLTPEQKALEQKAAEEFAQFLALKDQAKAKLAVGHPTIAELPLNSVQEDMRKLTMAGDFAAMHTLQPFTVHAWNEATPLGKYRFNIVNGKKVYVPFTDEEIERFVFNHVRGPYIIEPGAECDVEAVAKKFKEEQATNKKLYPNTDWRHVVPIYPGAYICKVYRPSTWVKWRGVVAVAVAAVAAVYLGPIISEKIAAMSTTGQTAGESATVFSKIKTTANNVLGYVNKARTVDAIVHGELPPPPISIVGNTFTEWAMAVAKEEIVKEAKERAVAMGMEYVQKKMTEAEERKLREEIEAMQRELAALIPPDAPAKPDPAVPAPVQQTMLEEKKQAETTSNLLMVGIPAALALILLG